MRRTSTRQREQPRRATNRILEPERTTERARGAGPPTPVRRNGKNSPSQPRRPWSHKNPWPLRDRLLEELEALNSPEAATTWAHRILGAKNSLTAADARRVEDAFQAKLTALGAGDDAGGVEATPLFIGGRFCRYADRRSSRPQASQARSRVRVASTRAHSSCPSHVAFATRTMSGSSPNSRV